MRPPVLPTPRRLIFSLFTRAMHHSNHNKHNLNCDLSSQKIRKSLQKQLLPECCGKEMGGVIEKENVIKSMQEKKKKQASFWVIGFEGFKRLRIRELIV